MNNLYASVIIPSYNRVAILDLNLKCLCGQTIEKSKYEVIIVDDGSVDATGELPEKYRKQGLNIKYFYQEHTGFRAAKARNEGIKQAKGKLLIFIDSDVLVSNDFIENHLIEHYQDYRVNILTQDSDKIGIGYIFSNEFKITKEDFYQKIEIDHFDASLARLKAEKCFLDIREYIYNKIEDDFSRLPAPWALFWSSNLSMEKRVISAVNGFNEVFNSWGMEDVECGYRLYRKNFPFRLIRNAAGAHHPHDRNKENLIKTNFSNKYIFYTLHPSAETEIYQKCTAFSYQDEYREYLAINKNVTPLLYSEIIHRDKLPVLQKFINNENSIIFGCQDGFLCVNCRSKFGLEIDTTQFKLSVEKYPDLTLRNCLGIQLPEFQDKQFAVSLVAGVIQLLPQFSLQKLCEEAVRIAERTYAIVPEKYKRFFVAGWRYLEQLTSDLSLFVHSPDA